MTRHIETPEHEHRDPRMIKGRGKVSGPANAHIDVRQQNHGSAKTRGVGRMDVVVNWFRRGSGR